MDFFFLKWLRPLNSLSTDVLRAFSALSHHWENVSSGGALPWKSLWTASYSGTTKQKTSISLKFNFVSQLTLINQFPNYQKLNKLNRGKSRLTSSLPLLEGFALFVCVVDAGGAFCWGCPFKVGNSVVTPPWLL